MLAAARTNSTHGDAGKFASFALSALKSLRALQQLFISLGGLLHLLVGLFWILEFKKSIL